MNMHIPWSKISKIIKKRLKNANFFFNFRQTFESSSRRSESQPDIWKNGNSKRKVGIPTNFGLPVNSTKIGHSKKIWVPGKSTKEGHSKIRGAGKFCKTGSSKNQSHIRIHTSAHIASHIHAQFRGHIEARIRSHTRAHIRRHIITHIWFSYDFIWFSYDSV